MLSGFFSMVQLVLFVIATIFLLYVSRKSLLHLDAHGFYRFFVFECAMACVIVNLPYWFCDPLSYVQIVSWLFLLNSILLVILSYYFLSKFGGSAERKDTTTNFEFENTAKLVTEGIYKYIRHPMYGSLLFLVLGAFLKHITPITVALTAIAIVFLILTAKIEEKENIKFFDLAYEEYMEKTKMFIPFIF
jgi:protein-S-isoprenylcysteine O-methyltransferase Ste14